MPSAHVSRLIFVTSILLFALVAGLTVLQTLGYVIDWRSGQVERQAALGVTATARATVRLNSQVVGQTPFRQPRLKPGTYTLSLERENHQAWSTVIRLEPGEAASIGPVVLFPTTPVTVMESLQDRQVLFDAKNQLLFSIRTEKNGQSTIINLQTKEERMTILPGTPTAVTASPSGQWWAILTAQGVRYVASDDEQTWRSRALDQVSWSEISERVVFGMASGHLWEIDALNESSRDLGAVSSFHVSDGSLWTTTTADSMTTVWRHDLAKPLPATSATTLTGAWLFLSNPNHSLLLRSPLSHETAEVRVGAFGRVTVHDLGVSDTVWQDQKSFPFLLQSGSAVSYVLKDRPAVLLDRIEYILSDAWWQEEHQTVWTVEGSSIVVRGTSAQSGRGILASWVSPTGTFLGRDRQGGLWFRSTDRQSLTRWSLE